MASSSSDEEDAAPKIPEELGSIGMIELLESDQRPTFILDLEDYQDEETLRTTFQNSSLKSLPDVVELILKKPPSDTHKASQYTDFKDWACRPSTEGTSGDRSTITYDGVLWVCTTIRKRWRVVTISAGSSGPGVAPADGASKSKPPFRPSPAIVDNQKPRGNEWSQPPADWTDILPPSQHRQFFKDVNWSATSLGTLDTWADHLRQMVRFLMSDHRPAYMFWGKDRVMLYNEPYIAVSSKVHPALMGSPFKTAWGQRISQDLEPAFEDARKTGTATLVEDTPFYLERHGYLEEAFFTYSLVPIRDECGCTMGFYVPVLETTKQKIWERRTRTLISTVTEPDVTSYWSNVVKGFESNPQDIPLAVIYSLESDSNDPSVPSKICFQDALGLDSHHPLALKGVSVDQDDNPTVLLFKKAMAGNGPTILQKDNGDLPDDLLRYVKWRGFGEVSKAVVILPLAAGEVVLGLLFLGLNPRRTYDEDFDGFIKLLSRQLSTSLTTAVLIEQAKVKQAELSKNLAEGQSRFKALTELNTAGLFYISISGEVLYANDTWYTLTGHPKDEHTEMSFMNLVMDEDKPYLESEWHNMADLGIARTFELRLAKTWHHKESDTWKNVWILCSCSHEKNEDGSLRSIMGSTSDISLLKQAEEDANDRAMLSEQLARSQEKANEMQIRTTMEAEEARKSMEKFMDITSHEMRNPLSAIIQSADGIASSLLEFQGSTKTTILSDELVESNLEAIQIITLCAQHQCRIINDVLTLSKLDSSMLAVTPAATQPWVAVKGALKMFEGELLAHGIDLEFYFEASYRDYCIDWVMVDPSRVTQILINLMTNAIKFTRTEAKRYIKVSVGGSKMKPPNGEKVDLEWFPSRGVGSKRDLTLDAEWGEGELVYLYFAVRDTGRGLSGEEKTRLFHRFAQANPRTHIKYGGSGLGLFISRELTELHGGEIGLNSDAGEGSTFAFYVKGRRAVPPAEDLAQRNGFDGAQLTPSKKANSKPVDEASAKASPARHGADTKDENYEVLLVEDNLVNQKVLSKQLTKVGCVVHVANHGGEALEFLKTSALWKGNAGGQPLDVVLMDLEMPVMDGLTCARQVRELQSQGTLTGHVPIIAVTANARKEQIATSMAAGMDDIMPKPFRVAELLPKMEKLKYPKSDIPTGRLVPILK